MKYLKIYLAQDIRGSYYYNDLERLDDGEKWVSTNCLTFLRSKWLLEGYEISLVEENRVIVFNKHPDKNSVVARVFDEDCENLIEEYDNIRISHNLLKMYLGGYFG